MERITSSAILVALPVLAGCVPVLAVKAPGRRLIEVPAAKLPDPANLSRADVLDLTVRIRAGESTGSGIRVGPNAVLTCRHVIEKSDSVQVSWRGLDWPRPAHHGFLSEDEDLALLVLDQGAPQLWQELPLADAVVENETALVCGYPENRFTVQSRRILSDRTMAGISKGGASGSGSWVKRGNRYVLAGVLYASNPPIANPKTYMIAAAEVAEFFDRVRKETATVKPAEAKRSDATHTVIIRER